MIIIGGPRSGSRRTAKSIEESVLKGFHHRVAMPSSVNFAVLLNSPLGPRPLSQLATALRVKLITSLSRLYICQDWKYFYETIFTILCKYFKLNVLYLKDICIYLYERFSGEGIILFVYIIVYSSFRFVIQFTEVIKVDKNN